MIRLVTVFAAAMALTLAAPNPVNVFKIDITPEEAQQYLNSPPFNEPQLSGQTATLPLVRYDSPQFRTADAGPTLGHYWKNGHEIENTDDYVEEVYDASQFHGQDGLGAFAYGYKTPESSKVENRARSGDVTGSYTYKAGSSNDLIKVKYWADSEGFHQEDNLPKIELQPAQETEEVRQARLAHEQAWQEAAAAAAQQPDPQGEYSAQQQQQQYQYQPSASEPQGVSVSAPGQPAREAKAYPSAQANYQSKQQFGQQKFGQQQGQKGQYNQQSSQYQSASSFGQQSGQQYGQQQASASAQYGQQQQNQGSHYDEPEPTGPPRGFFYAFDYPVSIIVRKDAQGQNKPVNPGQPIDNDTVGVSSPNYG